MIIAYTLLNQKKSDSHLLQQLLSFDLKEMIVLFNVTSTKKWRCYDNNDDEETEKWEFLELQILSFQHYFFYIMKLNRFQKIILISGIIATTAIVFKMMSDKKNVKKDEGPFIPTNEWKEVLPGQAVPKVVLYLRWLFK